MLVVRLLVMPLPRKLQAFSILVNMVIKSCLVQTSLQ